MDRDPIAILTALVGDKDEFVLEAGTDACAWCGATPDYGKPHHGFERHSDDCPWRAAVEWYAARSR